MFRLSFSIFFLLFTFIFGETGYKIKEYNIDINISKNNIYNITEEIKVDFLENRHGIFRTIPTYYKGRQTQVSDVKTSVEATLKKESKNLHLKLGNPNTTVIGRKNYLITFNQDLGWDEIRDYDEIYYNIVGSDWYTNIEKVNFNITLPRAFDSNKISFTSGIKGNLINSHVSWTVKNNTISGYTTKSLKPNESITIALPLREGYFDVYIPPEKTSFEKIIIFIKTLPKIGLVYIILILVFLVFFKNTNNSSKIIISNEFYPPDNLTPAEIGYIIEGNLTSSHMISMIYYWAHKGYLEIHDFYSGKNIKLQKSSEIREGKNFEVFLFNQLFTYSLDGQTVVVSSLRNKFYLALKQASYLLINDMNKRERKIFETSLLSKTISRLIPSIPFLGFGYLITSKSSRPIDAIISVGGGVITTIILQKFLRSNKKRTDYGYSLLGRCLGYKNFLKEESLNSSFQENSNYFYEHLPYVISLNLNTSWGNKFKDLVKEPPHWYHSRYYHNHFDSLMFMSHLNNSYYHLSKQLYSPPNQGESHSSSDGGSSGGGAGGGGGGSW